MIQKIIALDQWLFLKINQQGKNDLFDTVMPFFREAKFWIPFYLFMVLLVFFNVKQKVWVWLLFAVGTIAISDPVSSRIFKPYFDRPRPCADVNFGPQVRLLLDYCSSSGSFTSSHAANHFGLAMFLFLTLQNLIGWQRYLLFLWAFMVSYAQIYVGVHYPADVLGGACIGIAAGGITGYFYNKKFGLTTNQLSNR